MKKEKCKKYKGFFITSSLFSLTPNFLDTIEDSPNVECINIDSLCKLIIEQSKLKESEPNVYIKIINHKNLKPQTLTLILEEKWNKLLNEKRG